ncbi:Hsp20/alpha crystallin family protein [Ciceribacter ferrooxidans]|uniref:Hsp20/alpha crystallin family protein n=1 Tax=Ciceribacter ferrooxidans TaxID=2509717 RepID=A0A4Q2S8Z9_9HYPH|nr:Hsp20/alpha crystallin family protein [Ciceribacter ferrooxidans]RYB97053.1 Hsp20/alpha crystallin family protein [Ciceribacter ferrooxidans]
MNDKSSGSLPSLWSDNPFAEFRKEMDKVFDGFFGRGGLLKGADKTEGFMAPSIDVAENDTAITLTAELPGISESDVDVSIQNGVLTLKGEKKFEKKDEKDNYRLVERRYGSFQRSMSLPASVDEAAVTAKFDKGVLTVTMPKKPGSAPKERKIAIEK